MQPSTRFQGNLLSAQFGMCWINTLQLVEHLLKEGICWLDAADACLIPRTPPNKYEAGIISSVIRNLMSKQPLSKHIRRLSPRDKGDKRPPPLPRRNNFPHTWTRCGCCCSAQTPCQSQGCNRDYRGTNTRFHLADHHLDLDKLKLPESRLNLDTAICELSPRVANTIKASTPQKTYFIGSG